MPAPTAETQGCAVARMARQSLGAFKDPDKSPHNAKQMVLATVQRVSGGKLSDVLIESLTLP